MGTLHIGDLVFISEGEGEGMALGVLAGGGVQLGAREAGPLSTSFASESVFLVQQQQNYSAAKNIRGLVESEGRPAIELAAEPEHRRLFEERDRELLANESAFERSIGREVRYGHMIQLQHARTKLMLAVTRHTAHVSKDARRATIEPDAAEAAWFRVMPRLRIHSEGERVRLGDPAVLEHVATGLKLRVERLGKLPDGRREVSAAAEPSSIKISLYRCHEPPPADGGAQSLGTTPSLMGGAPIRMMHKEADGYMGNALARAILGMPVLVAREDTHVPASCDTMWEVHKADVTDGGPCVWSGRFRIVHTASNLTLTVSDEVDEIEEACEEWEAEYGDTDSNDDDVALRVVLAQIDASDTTCLFELCPQYQQRDTLVRLDAFFRLRHVATGRWLHFNSKGFERADASANIFGGHNDGDAGGGSSREASPSGRSNRSARGSPLRRACATGVGTGVTTFPIDGVAGLPASSSRRGGTPPTTSSPLACTIPAAKRSRPPASASVTAGGEAQAGVGGAHSLEDLARAQVAAEAAGPAVGWCGRLVATRTLYDEDVFGLTPVGADQYTDLTRALAWRSPICQFIARFHDPRRASATTGTTIGTRGSPPLTLPVRSQIDFSPLLAALSELIIFVTRSDNPNPYTREGLPHAHRQLLLRELQVLDLALEAIAAPLRSSIFERSELSGEGQSKRSPIWRAGTLCMLLARHVLREHNANKAAALRFVPQLQELLGLGIRAADTLTQVFVDNEAQLLKVEDAHVYKFVSLIRTAGREAKFLAFLVALCQCHGSAIRHNQWRVAEALLRDAPELLPTLSIDPRNPVQVLVSGNGKYFDGLNEQCPIKLNEWLDTVDEEAAAYLEKSLELCAALATGRNLRNAPLLRERLPYDLLVATVASKELHSSHLGISAAAAAVIRCLYVDTEPHQLMARVKTVRIWANVLPAAQSGALSSRLTTVLDIDWKRFDSLKVFMLAFLRQYEAQDARQIQENRMVLQLLKLFHELLVHGFYRATDVEPVLPRLLALLDGRQVWIPFPLTIWQSSPSPANGHPAERRAIDLLASYVKAIVQPPPPASTPHAQLPRRGTPHAEFSMWVTAHGPCSQDVVDGTEGLLDDSSARYVPRRTVSLDTLVIMECKLILCRILSLLSDVRLDLRLSQLLAHFRNEWDIGSWVNSNSPSSRYHIFRVGRVDSAKQTAIGLATSSTISQKFGASSGMAYTRLDEDSLDEPSLTIHDGGSQALARSVVRERRACFDGLWQILVYDTDGMLVPILMDLTFYDHQPLVSAALGLLVCEYEQRRSLRAVVEKTQLLVKPEMVQVYGTFDEVLRKLGLLASRRQLFDDEPYQALLLLGQLVSFCSEETDEPTAEMCSVGMASVGRCSAGVASNSRTNRTGRSGTSRSGMHTSTDHTQGIYLLLIGRARAKLGSDRLFMTKLDHTRPPRQGDRLQIEGLMYTVRAVQTPETDGTDGAIVMLDKRLALERGVPTPTELRPGGSGEVWLMLLCHSAGYNFDMQVLLRNMGAHKLALKLLALPVADEPLPAEYNTRAVIRGAYRLIKAMASGFPQLQAELVPSIPTFVAHVQKKLVAYDISPTGTISATLRDNRAACGLVSPDTIRHFVRLAAQEHAPRFLRFLSLLCLPGGVPIKRNQALILQTLADNERALLLFSGVGGRTERAALIAANDHIENPRGRLAYHIELVGLLATITIGENAAVEGIMREFVPLPELVENLLIADLPIALRGNYVRLFFEAFLRTEKPVREVATSDDLPQLIAALSGELSSFVDELPFLNLADEPEARARASYFCYDVLPTLSEYFREHFSTRRAAADEAAAELRALGGQVGDALLELQQEALGQEEVLPAAPIGKCIRALYEAGVLKESVARRVLADVDTSTEPGKTTKSTIVPAGKSLLSSAATGHPQERLPEFLNSYDLIVHPETEFTSLVDIFAMGLDAECDAREAKLTGRRRKYSSRRDASAAGRAAAVGVADGRAATAIRGATDAAYTRNLLQQLLRGRVTAEMPLDRALTVASMRVLIALLTLPPGQEARRQRRQVLLADEGACSVCLMMGACEDKQLYGLGMTLTIALLVGGNTHVQRCMHTALAVGGIEPFDGSNGSWMGEVKARLRRGIKEIAERKLFLAQQAERRAGYLDEVDGLSPAAAAAVKADIERDFDTSAYVAETVEALRLMCEGHFTPLQEYLRDPRGGRSDSSAEPIDLVTEVYALLAELEPELDGDNIDQATACVTALTEFIQGNISGANTRLLIESKLPEVLDRLACKLDYGPSIKSLRAATLRVAVATLLLALLEGSGRQAEMRLLQVLDLERIGEVAAESFRRGKVRKKSTLSGFVWESAQVSVRPEAAEEAEEECSLLLESGFAMYTLLRHLHDYQEEAAVNQVGGVSLSRGVPAGALEMFSGGDGLEEHKLSGGDGAEGKDSKSSVRGMGRFIGRCEIVNATGKLERVYFRIPDFCLLLTEESKQELLWGVDRDTPGKQIQELFERSDELMREMKHQQRLARSPLWQLVMRNKPVADNLVLNLALAQNCVIMLRFSWTPDASEHLEYLIFWENIANTAMGSLQLCACVLVFTIYAIDRAPLRVWRGFRLATGHGAEEILGLPFRRWHPSWYLILPYYALADAQLALLACLSFASVLGLLVSPLWFSVHLLDIVNKSADLQNVFKAVTLNGRSIAMTALFGAIIIYLFAVVGYASAAEVFVLGNYPDEDVPMCTSLFSCFLNALNEGLRSGDIGSFMDPAMPGDISGYAFRFAYQLSFWAIVITILLNVIFGIIIDTFGELRSVHAAKKSHMENICFICGLDRFTLDTKGPGFEHHVKHEHNMWAYLHMIIYLKEKDPTEYNGWEQHVAALMAKDDASFFPRNRALSVGGGDGDGDDEGGNALGEQGGQDGSGGGSQDPALAALSDQLIQLVDAQARMSEALASLIPSSVAVPSRLTARASGLLSTRSVTPVPANEGWPERARSRESHSNSRAEESNADPQPGRERQVEVRYRPPGSITVDPVPSCSSSFTELAVQPSLPLLHPATLPPLVRDNAAAPTTSRENYGADVVPISGPDVACDEEPPAPSRYFRDGHPTMSASAPVSVAPTDRPTPQEIASSPAEDPPISDMLSLPRGTCSLSQHAHSPPLPSSCPTPIACTGGADIVGTPGASLTISGAPQVALVPIVDEAASAQRISVSVSPHDVEMSPSANNPSVITQNVTQSPSIPHLDATSGVQPSIAPLHGPRTPERSQPGGIREKPSSLPTSDLPSPQRLLSPSRRPLVSERVSGWLYKKGEINPVWRRRYFALAPLELRWWDDISGFNAGMDPKGSVPLSGIGNVSVRPPGATGVTPGRYQLIIAPRENERRSSSASAVGRSHSTQRLSSEAGARWLEIETETVAELERWVTAIRAALRARQAMNEV